MFSRWMTESGVSRTTSTSGRRSLSVGQHPLHVGRPAREAQVGLRAQHHLAGLGHHEPDRTPGAQQALDQAQPVGRAGGAGDRDGDGTVVGQVVRHGVAQAASGLPTVRRRPRRVHPPPAPAPGAPPGSGPGPRRRPRWT